MTSSARCEAFLVSIATTTSCQQRKLAFKIKACPYKIGSQAKLHLTRYTTATKVTNTMQYPFQFQRTQIGLFTGVVLCGRGSLSLMRFAPRAVVLIFRWSIRCDVITLFLIEWRSPSPSGGPPWDLISEKLCIEVNGERKIIFRSRLNCATNYTYDVCQFKR